MAIEYFLQSIQVIRLKGLIDADVIRFEEDKPLTALMGPNGFGKSSILHVLAASFRPIKVVNKTVKFDAGESYHYPNFLPSTPDEKWTGTDVNIVTRETKGDNVEIKLCKVLKMAAGTWQPQQEQKIARETYFIGVSTALPEIEAKRTSDDFLFTTTELNDDDSTKLRKFLGVVFNRDYSKVFNHEIADQKKIIGLTHRSISYSSLTMGAGEQRIFKMLKVVIAAQKHALILIDEIDLLLHAEALDRLLKILSEIASKKNLQIIFTTHRESVLQHNKWIAIRHVFKSTQAPFKTHWFADTKPGAIERLTGILNSSIVICCEDNVAESIVYRVAEQLGIAQHIEIKQFGSWSNCFTLAAALAIEKKFNENSLFVLDGDIEECKMPEQWKNKINTLLAGSSKASKDQRELAFKAITQFHSPEGLSPERTLYDMLRSVANSTDSSEQLLMDAFLKLETVQNGHDYVIEPLRRLKLKQEVGLARVVTIASRSAAWDEYVKPVYEWLKTKKSTLLELQNAGA